MEFFQWREERTKEQGILAVSSFRLEALMLYYTVSNYNCSFKCKKYKSK